MSANAFNDTIQQLTSANKALRRKAAALEAELDSLRDEYRKLEERYAALRADYEALVDATQAVTEDRDKHRERIEELEAITKRLTQMLWGPRSERREASPNQRQLDFGDDPPDPPTPEEQELINAQDKLDEAADEEFLRRREERRKARRDKEKPGGSFPAHFERREKTVDLPDDEKEGLKHFKVATTERMCFEPPKAYVEVIHRHEYVVEGRPEEGVKSEPPPLAIVPGCKYDFSVIAAVVAMKMAFHNPTYRQQNWFAQCGWFPTRSTCNDLINHAVTVTDALYQQMWSLLLASSILLGDDTRIRLLTRGALTEEQLAQLEGRKTSDRPGSVTSYAWYYGGLDALGVPYDVFHWSLTHQHSVLDGHLADFRGVFLGDADGANARVEQRSGGRIRHGSCNGHARRKFITAESHEPVIASQGLSFYRQLYDVEERGKLLDDAGRLALRQRAAVPIWDRMKVWLASQPVQRVLPKSPTGEALGYLANQWSALQVYLSDGRIPFTNDASEQRIRPLAIGRKNWLFLGHPEAAAGRLQLYSIVSSANRHHLKIHDYLVDVLAKLADARQYHPQDLELGSPYLLDLLPDRWAAAHPDLVCQERVEERERVWDEKRARRARDRINARKKQSQAASRS